MKASITTLHKGKYWMVLESLRDHPNEPAMKRVEEILSLLVSAEIYRQEHVGYHDSGSQERLERGGIPELLNLMKRSKESERAYYQALELLNIKLNRYRWEAKVRGDTEGFRSEISPANPKGKWDFSGRKLWDGTELWKYSEYTESFVEQRDKLLAHLQQPRPSWEPVESFLIASLLRALDEGEISRFRRCLECKQWLYAIRAHQHFCGEACRRKHEAQNPAFKQKRAKYMREKYRPKERRKDAAAKRHVGFSGKPTKGGR